MEEEVESKNEDAEAGGTGEDGGEKSGAEVSAADRRSAAELHRLRLHLIHVEEGYTEELLLAEQREKDLRTRLADCEQKIQRLEHQLRRTSVQHGTLEELENVRQERDAALTRVSQQEDHVHQLSATVQRLNLLLEQRRRECEDKVQEWEKRLYTEKQRTTELEKRLKWQEERFAQSAEALAAAGRLTEQMDAKQRQVSSLQEEVSIREKEVQVVRKELQAVNATLHSKLDKQLVKSVVLSYLCAPSDRKEDVGRLLARILDFDQQESQRAKLSHQSFWQRHQTAATPAPDSSLATLFVRFLESESAVPNPAQLASNSQPVRQLAHSLMTTSLRDPPAGTPNGRPSPDLT